MDTSNIYIFFKIAQAKERWAPKKKKKNTTKKYKLGKKNKEEEKKNEGTKKNNKNQKKKRKGNATGRNKNQRKEKRRRRRRAIGKNPCASARGHFHHFLPLSFSPLVSSHMGEKTFWWVQGEKSRNPPSFIFFPLPFPTKHPLKKFSFLNFPSFLKFL